LKIFEEFDKEKGLIVHLQNALPKAVIVQMEKGHDAKEMERYTGVSADEWDIAYYVGMNKTPKSLEELQNAMKEYDPTLDYSAYRYDDNNSTVESFVLVVRPDKDNMKEFAMNNTRNIYTLAKLFPKEMRDYRGQVASQKFRMR
jgi:hypothetical protein